MPETVICRDIDGNPRTVRRADLHWRPSAYAVVIKDDHILLFNFGGHYVLPGGGLELGEMPEAALIREVQEETGVAVANPKLLGVESSLFVMPGRTEREKCVQSILLYYRCEYVSGELTSEGVDEAEQDHNAYPEWVPVEKLTAIEAGSSVDWRKYVSELQ